MNGIRTRWTARDDDSGAILVTVVVVMFVGFIIAATIAASVIFTVSANVDNRDRTQAFIAAESGRDVAVAALRSAIGSAGIPSPCPVALSAESASGTQPEYEYAIRVADDGDEDTVSFATPPSGWDASGLAEACPTDTTEWVVVRSTGTGPNEAETTVDAVYPWYHGPATTPSGTVAFFEGQFTATKTTYAGDLVIRDGDYECNTASEPIPGGGTIDHTIDGDLWVLRGGLKTTGECTVTGSIYARDLINIKNNGVTIGGDVISVTGQIKLNTTGISVGGDVYAAGSIDTKNGDGTVEGSFRTHAAMIDHKDSAWKKADGVTPVPVLLNEPVPAVTPTLPQVYDATTWIELTETTPWSSPTHPVFTPPAGSICTQSELQALMTTAGTRAVVDMTGCALTGSGIEVAPGNVISLARDVVIIVPAVEKMDLKLTGTISKPAGLDPQLFIVHADQDGGDDKPTCPDADTFAAGGVLDVRIMIYTACGIQKTMSLTMTGQLYMGSDGLHLNGGVFTCKPMSWEPTLPGISCGVKGEGGIYDPTREVSRLENLEFQTER